MSEPRQPYRPFTLAECQTATAFLADYMDRVRAAFKDQEEAQRKAKHLCRACYYLRGHQGGTMTTAVYCGGCGEVMRFGSTATDRLCKACAEWFGVCCRCGADPHEQHRRVLERKRKR